MTAKEVEDETDDLKAAEAMEETLIADDIVAIGSEWRRKLGRKGRLRGGGEWKMCIGECAEVR